MALTHHETKAPDGNGEKPESTSPFLHALNPQSSSLSLLASSSNKDWISSRITLAAV